MLRRIFTCFILLSLVLVLCAFFLFTSVILPQYRSSLLSEVQSLTNMQGEDVYKRQVQRLARHMYVAGGRFNQYLIAHDEALLLMNSPDSYSL